MAAPIRKPSGSRQELVEPPQMPRPQRGVFEGDVAAVELRSRLARLRLEPPMPAERRLPRFYAALQSVGLVVIAALAAGAAGYLLGDFGGIARLRHIGPLPHIGPVPHIDLGPFISGLVSNAGPARAKTPHASGADLMPVPPRQAAASTPTNFRSAGGNSQLPAPQTAMIDIMPAGRPQAAGQREAALPPVIPPAVPAQDPAEIAAKMKLGADLLASGDIAAARMMFSRVAEAGEVAGAFALAETYDPAVLRTLRLRGAIAADPALARHWYEQARDMGSMSAIERIARLAP